MRTIIVSDIHLGSNTSRPLDLLDFLASSTVTEANRLIVAGDLRDGIAEIDENGWLVLQKLKQLSAKLEVIFLPGNHDPDAEVLAEILNVKYQQTYLTEDKKIFITHGHLWDPNLSNYPWLTNFGNQFNYLVSCVWPSLAIRLKRLRKWLFNVRGIVQDSALNLGFGRDYQTVICGHVHFAEDVTRSYEHTSGSTRFPGVQYLNTGSWCEEVCTYAVIEDGLARLCFWPGRENV
jgi:UDP-2,3-diacylglucosamine pyrophosphatase LpxH